MRTRFSGFELAVFCILLIAAMFSQIGCTEKTSTLRDEAKQFGIEKGWQLQVPPVSKLSAGMIYREDSEGHIYRVTTLSIPAETMDEGDFEYKTKVRTTADALVQFFGVGKIIGDVGKEIQIVLAMKNITRETTNDFAVDKALKRFWEEVKIRPHEKYYIIRETRAASQVNTHLTRTVLGEIGGEATLNNMIGASATFQREDQGSVIVKGVYNKRMYVMFLPQEIKMVSAGLAGEPPKFGQFPVERILTLGPEMR